MIRKNFNLDWKVERGGGALAALFGQGEPPKPVTLPHDAMIHETPRKDAPSGSQTGFYPGGDYHYTKTIYAPEEWIGKDIYLEFEGVYQIASVYVNENLVAHNFYGYSEFTCAIDKYLNFGHDNCIKVHANNSAVPNSRWYSGSGIYRNVNLLVGGDVHIRQNSVRVTTKEASDEYAVVEVETKLTNITRAAHQVKVHTEISYAGETVKQDTIRLTVFSLENETVRQNMLLRNPKLWSSEVPDLYDVKINVTEVVAEKETVLDSAEVKTGIRILSLDAERGLRINGKEVKLAGSCIHHDNGILGAATYAAAEDKRARELKAAGFNAIRSAHHPMSRAMLDACDKYGILVMDELTDIWNLHKNANDFSQFFDTSWEEEVERMVAKDYNHPCVVLYSTGNEILDLGLASGGATNRKVSNKFHELDSTRYTTIGGNGLMAATISGKMPMIMGELMAKKNADPASAVATTAVSGNQDSPKTEAGADSEVGAMNMMMSLMYSDEFCAHPLLTDALEEGSQATDIAGYNYLTGRHVIEKELHPNKPIVGTETYPSDIPRLWGIVKRNHHVLGDFTWTGYDYLGEAGCGIFYYDGTMNFASRFPDRLAYIGDINILGYRRPVSYWREIVFGSRKEPYIGVIRMNRYGLTSSRTFWLFKDNVASWTWPGYEGKETEVDIYSAADEVELFINGKSQGRKTCGEDRQFIATYTVIYEPGEIKAVSYENDKISGEFSLKTAAQKVVLSAAADRSEITAGAQDLAFVTVTLRDEAGLENIYVRKEVTVTVEGAGELAAYGSADPSPAPELSYDNTCWPTYDGQVMAAIRSGTGKGSIRVTFSADGCEDAVVEIACK